MNLKLKDLMQLIGVPRGLEGDIDETLPVSNSGPIDASGLIDPLACFAGRTSIHFSADGGACKVAPLSPYVDRANRTVTSTNAQLKLDYGNGILRINAPQAQGVSGNITRAGIVQLADMTVSSPMDLGHIIAVSLDGQPLSGSRQILLQVASEEKSSGFKTQPVGNGRQQIISIGQDPWLMKAIAGTVKMNRADAADLKVTALNFNGYPKRELVGKQLGGANGIHLLPDTMYYLITK